MTAIPGGPHRTSAPRLRRLVVLSMLVAVPLALWNWRSLAVMLLNATASIDEHRLVAGEAYGEHPRQVLDVYLPARADGGPRALVIFWHGGMWTRGSKDDAAFVGAALADMGVVAVLPNYRLSPEVMYPAFVEDGATALAWARENAEAWGADPDRVVLMGHSAGAYIAATLALSLSARCTNCGSGVRAWIGLSGPYALRREVPLVSAVFGPQPDPIALQPGLVATERAPPALLVDTTGDWMIGPEQANAMRRELVSRGVRVERLTLEGGSHSDPLVAFSVLLRNQTVVSSVCRFVGEATQTYTRCAAAPQGHTAPVAAR